MSIVWFVYLARCSDDSLYCGIAHDVDKRIALHNAGKGAKCLRGKRPVTAVWQEGPFNLSRALQREAAVKRMSKDQKEALTEGAVK